MPSSILSPLVLLAVITGFVVAVLAWGVFISHQVLLASIIAVCGALLGGVAYAVIRYLGGSGGNGGTDADL